MTDAQDKETFSQPRFFSAPNLEELANHPLIGRRNWTPHQSKPKTEKEG
jgi:hypothetical protein